jgi:uncharacterized protein (DUF1330 family)
VVRLLLLRKSGSGKSQNTNRVRRGSRYKEYIDKLLPTYAQFAAKFLVRGGQTVAIPGAGEPPERAVVVVFESLDKAKAWSESDAVKQSRLLRDRAAKLHAYLVEGAQ